MKIAGVNEIGSMEEQHVKVSVGGGNVQRKGEMDDFGEKNLLSSKPISAIGLGQGVS